MPLKMSANPPFVVDENNIIVGVTGQRFAPKSYTNFNPVSVVPVASTFSTVTSFDSNSGNVRLNGTGTHGLTTAVVITPAINTGVYVTWTAGSGVSGVYPVTAIDTDTTGTKLTINLPYVSSTVTATATDPGIVTYASHGRSAGQAVRFTTTNTLPAGLSTGTTYYISSIVDANQFTVSASAGGTPIAFTDTGTGTHTCILWYGTAAVKAATEAITLASLTIEGGLLSLNGNMECNAIFSMTSAGGVNKVLEIEYAGNEIYNSGNLTTTTTANVNKIVWARGAGKIVTGAASATGHGTGSVAYQEFTVAYGSDQTFVIKATIATANNIVTLEGYQVTVE